MQVYIYICVCVQLLINLLLSKEQKINILTCNEKNKIGQLHSTLEKLYCELTKKEDLKKKADINPL
jgi:hypothetical protein